MIRHIVLWKFKDEAGGKTKDENLRMIRSILDELPAKISDIRQFEVGINITKDTAAYDLALISAFDDEDALRRYQAHPEHQKLVDALRKVRESRVIADFPILDKSGRLI
ncbi:MAG: Dabb family protein [Candidatus Riflebacteria bacterium]|nr:Dabb family protein [Candidatus Riflebacteria bacterium]